MSIPRYAAAMLAVTLCCGSASALLTTHADPLEDWIQLEGPNVADPATQVERRRQKAVSRAAAELGRESEDLHDDAKRVARALKRLARPYAGDAGLEAVMSVVVGKFESDLVGRRDSLVPLPARLDEEKIGKRITKRLAPVTRFRDRAAATDDPVRRMQLLVQAFARLGKVERTAEPVAKDGDDRFVLVLGENNSPIRVFAADRQTDAATLIPTGDDGRVRTAWEQGDTPDAIGNYQLVINWQDTDADLAVDTARVQLFRLIGLDTAPEAWYANTFTLGLGSLGVSIEDTPEGTRVTFDGTELRPDAGSTNGASGIVRLQGRLLLRP